MTRPRLFAYYFVTSFLPAAGVSWLFQAAFGVPPFAAFPRMFTYHHQHPYQYIALACFMFALVAAALTPLVARLTGWRRDGAILGVLLGSVVVASVPGGVLWSLHDMQAGWFPTGDRFWNALAWGAETGAQVGWLIIAFSIPYNFLGLIVGYFLVSSALPTPVRHTP